MAISAVHKTNESGSGSTLTTTATLVPVVNRLYLCTVAQRAGVAPTVPTVSGGGGLTWVQVATVAHSANFRAITLFRAMKSSGLTSGTVAASFGGQSQTISFITIEELTSIDTTGVDGAGAIVQSATAVSTANGTSSSVTLAAFADATNNAVFSSSCHTQIENTNPESGYTELSDQSGGGTGFEVAWKIGQDTTPTTSWVTSSAWVALATEIKFASASGGAKTRTLLGAGG